MKLNDDGKTVAAVDLEVPGAGELMGGSQREEDYDKLVSRIKELGMKEEDFGWYLNLRRYGGCVLGRNNCCNEHLDTVWNIEYNRCKKSRNYSNNTRLRISSLCIHINDSCYIQQ